MRLVVKLDDCKTFLYRQEDGAGVAEIPAIPGCYAFMPTREAALRELTGVFRMISEEQRHPSTSSGQALKAVPFQNYPFEIRMSPVSALICSLLTPLPTVPVARDAPLVCSIFSALKSELMSPLWVVASIWK